MDELRSKLEVLVREVCRCLDRELPSMPQGWVRVTHWNRVYELDSGSQLLDSSAESPNDEPSVSRRERRIEPAGLRLDFQSLALKTSIGHQVRSSPLAQETAERLARIMESDPRLAERFAEERRPQNPSDTPIDQRRQLRFSMAIDSFLCEYFLKAGEITYSQRAFDQVFASTTVEPSIRGCRSRLISPLINVHLLEPEVELAAGVKLRQVSLEEIEGWLNFHAPEMDYSLGAGGSTEILQSRCAIDVVTRDESIGNELTERAISSLRLLGHPVFPVLTERRFLGLVWDLTGWSGGAIPRARLCGQTVLGHSQIEVLRRLFTQLLESPNAARVALAVRRLNDAHDRQREDDKLIDYWIALESLFSPRNKGEITHRMAVSIACLLGWKKGPKIRKRIYENVKKSYDLRSDIVHGADVRGEQTRKGAKRKEIVEDTGRITREAVAEILGWEEDFDVDEVEARFLGTRWEGDPVEEPVDDPRAPVAST